MPNTIIKTSRHEILPYANTGKIESLHSFIDEYRRVASIIVNEIWNNGVSWADKNKESKRFSIKDNLLEFPMFLDYNSFDIGDTFLSARSLSSLVTQISGIIRASTEKQRKRLFMLDKNKSNGVPKKKMEKLIKKIKTNIPQKPNCERINVELSSKCSDWEDDDNKEFIGFIRLKSITKDRTQFNIPIKGHKHSKKLSKKGVRKNSFLISKDCINVRWEIEKPDLRTEGEIVGCDQGMKDVLTCSNKMITPKVNVHGHSLESILKKMTKKKKGSKAFARTQKQRTNFINWSINQLNMDDFKEVRLERIFNIGFKSKQSSLLSHWTNTTIRDKIESKCEEEGIRLIHQSSTYRSQRCSCCGVVRKSNRKGKNYSCKHCGNEIDADLNASLNHVVDLPEIPYTLRKMNLNRGNGFYWIESGFYDFSSGRSLESLLPVEDPL